jgi:hypothetical protein
MADKKISELVSLAGKDVAATDFFPVVDVSVTETKSLTRDELRNAVNAIQFTATKALATTAAASLPDDTIIEVAADESLSGARTRYTVAAGALVFAYGVATQAELDAVVADLADASDPAKGAALVGFLPAGTSAVATTVHAKLRETISVKDFGAAGDGVTDDRLAIKAAVSALQAAGGGELIFPRGDYLLATMDGTYDIPRLNESIQWDLGTSDVQLYFTGLSNIVFRFKGARLVSSKTNGGITLAFNGCNNLVFENISMQGATVMSGSTATVAGTGAIAILSTSQNSANIVFNSPKIDGHYSAIDITGNPASVYRAKNITVDGSASFRNGYYGVSCRGNGVGVRVVDAYSYRLNRPFFIYDTQEVHIKMVCDEMNGGHQALVKAYTANVINVTIDMSVRNRANISTCLGFQSQHNPVVQPTPGYLRDIKVRYSDFASVSGGESIRFDYYQNDTLTTTTNKFLFGDIVLEGRSSGGVTSGVALESIANYCVLYMEKFKANNGFSLYANNSGFIPARISTWTPIDGSAAAISFTTATGRYTVGEVISGSFAVTYPVTESTIPAAIEGLPVRAHGMPQNAVAVSVGYTDCGFHLCGLIDAYGTRIRWYKNTGVSVTNQELSGKTIRGSFMYFA